MSIFNSLDALNICLMMALMTLFALSLYWPLLVILKDPYRAKISTIPTSFSFLIVLGYIFYCTPYFKYFPLSYYVLLIVVNTFSFFYLRKNYFFKKNMRSKREKWWLVVVLLVLGVVLYNRFFDSITNLAPGTIDTFSHFRYVKELREWGYLKGFIYPPGFHILVFPFSEIFAWKYIYRFVGPTLGVVFFIQTYFFATELIGKGCSKDSAQRGKVVIACLMLLPVFNIFFLQTMGFFSISLVMIFFTYWTVLLLLKKIYEIPFWILILQAVAMGVTAPHYFVMFLLGTLFLWLFCVLFKRRLVLVSGKNLLYSLLVAFTGLTVGFLHVVVQTLILRRGAELFPVIESVKGSGDSLILSNNLKYEYLFQSAFGKHYIAPIVGTAVDILSVKGVRGLDSAMALGGYLVVAISIAIIVYSYIKRKNTLAIAAVLLLIYGISVQTGFGEMSTYRGRNGYIFIFLTMVLVAMIYNLYVDQYIKNKIYLILPVVLVFALFFPPTYYRAYRTETYAPLYRLANEYQSKSIAVFAHDDQLASFSEDITVYPLSVENIEKCASDICVVVLENYFIADPSVSQQALPGDIGYKVFYEQEKKNETQRSEQKKAIYNSSSCIYYKNYYSSDNVDILYRIRIEE
ncbi:MAG TPA: hypothetical protein PLC05_01380 [bacterium]|nr:hypothetical protein [bacterium]HOR57143.1 hypothetical protein [bacterium]HPL56136.1 hypothetical protein [bacterium]